MKKSAWGSAAKDASVTLHNLVKLLSPCLNELVIEDGLVLRQKARRVRPASAVNNWMDDIIQMNSHVRLCLRARISISHTALRCWPSRCNICIEVIIWSGLGVHGERQLIIRSWTFRITM
jgi:hypothetical protein